MADALPPTDDESHLPHDAASKGRRRRGAIAAGAVLLAICIALMSLAQAGSPPEVSYAEFSDVPMPAGARFATTQSNIEIVKLTLPPGASTEWHSHGGPLVLSVKQGALTNYVAAGGRCVRSEVAAGHAFLEVPDQAHRAANEGKVDLVVYAVNNHAQDSPTSVDAPRPGGCPD